MLQKSILSKHLCKEAVVPVREPDTPMHELLLACLGLLPYLAKPGLTTLKITASNHNTNVYYSPILPCVLIWCPWCTSNVGELHHGVRDMSPYTCRGQPCASVVPARPFCAGRACSAELPSWVVDHNKMGDLIQWSQPLSGLSLVTASKPVHLTSCPQNEPMTAFCLFIHVHLCVVSR